VEFSAEYILAPMGWIMTNTAPQLRIASSYPRIDGVAVEKDLWVLPWALTTNCIPIPHAGAVTIEVDLNNELVAPGVGGPSGIIVSEPYTLTASTEFTPIGPYDHERKHLDREIRNCIRVGHFHIEAGSTHRIVGYVRAECPFQIPVTFGTILLWPDQESLELGNATFDANAEGTEIVRVECPCPPGSIPERVDIYLGGLETVPPESAYPKSPWAGQYVFGRVRLFRDAEDVPEADWYSPIRPSRPFDD
jgi:hypothetical protein